MARIQTILKTQRIKCQGCIAAARAAVEKLPGVERIEFDLPGYTVTVSHTDGVSGRELAQALTKAGFPSE